MFHSPCAFSSVNENPVDLQELAGHGFPLEEVGHLRLDALIASGDRGNGRGRCDRDQQGITQSGRGDPLPQRSPAVRLGTRNPPQIGLQLARGGPRPGERRMRAMGLGELRGRLQGRQVNLLRDPGGQLARRDGVERQPQREENVLQPHHAQADGPPPGVGRGNSKDSQLAITASFV